jgi:hypothetical protein
MRIAKQSFAQRDVRYDADDRIGRLAPIVHPAGFKANRPVE